MFILGRLRSKPDPEKEKALQEGMKDIKLSWQDKFAMMLSACLVLVIPAVLVLLGFGLLILLLAEAL